MKSILFSTAILIRWGDWLEGEKDFLSHNLPFQVHTVLKDAQSVGMMTAYHNYLITNMVGTIKLRIDFVPILN